MIQGCKQIIEIVGLPQPFDENVHVQARGQGKPVDPGQLFVNCFQKFEALKLEVQMLAGPPVFPAEPEKLAEGCFQAGLIQTFDHLRHKVLLNWIKENPAFRGRLARQQQPHSACCRSAYREESGLFPAEAYRQICAAVQGFLRRAERRLFQIRGGEKAAAGHLIGDPGLVGGQKGQVETVQSAGIGRRAGDGDQQERRLPSARPARRAR